MYIKSTASLGRAARVENGSLASRTNKLIEICRSGAEDHHGRVGMMSVHGLTGLSISDA
jgi:hypothetical protein